MQQYTENHGTTSRNTALTPPRAFIFDLDDTLIAYSPVSDPSWRQVCSEYCRKNPAVDEDLLYDSIRKRNAWYWSDSERHRIGRNRMEATRREILRLTFSDLGIPDMEQADRIADEFSRIRLENIYLFPAVHDTLTALRARGMKLALLTNGEDHLQWGKIRRFALEDCFDYIQTEGGAGYGKPDLRAYQAVTRALDIPPEESVIVGDNLEWEIRVPASLGFRTVWMDVAKSGLPAGYEGLPFGVIRSPEEVLRLFPETPHPARRQIS